MPEERLLDRIRAAGRDPERRAGVSQRRCIDSVVSHLQRILNTRQGNVLIAEDYGVPDFLDFLQTHPESVHRIELSIKNAIDKYEPRLAGTSVTYLSDGEDVLSLHFQITACLTAESKRKIFLESVIGSDGRVRLRS